MPVREMVQQVAEGEYRQLFFEQVASLRTYSFEVFDGMGQYVLKIGYDEISGKNNCSDEEAR
jgi:hypothetical protein